MPNALREAAAALGAPHWKVIPSVAYRAARSGMLTGVLLAIARITRRDRAAAVHRAQQPVLEHRTSNAPMANLPVVIFQFAMSPYDDWQSLAWGGALLITVASCAQHRRPRVLAQHLGAVEMMANPRQATSPAHERRPLRADHARTRAARGAASEAAAACPMKVVIRNLDFFYGKHRGAEEHHACRCDDKRVTAFIGPSGCGKSTLLRVLNRIYDALPRQRATARCCSTARTSSPRARTSTCCAPSIGMVFQKPTPFPMSIYDNVAFGIRLYEKLPQSRARRPRRGGAAPRGAVGRGQGQAEAERPRPVRRPAAAPVHRPRHRASSPRCCCSTSRASALDPISTAKIEELIDELKTDYCIVIVTHNMQQAARVSDYTAFMYLGELIEFDETETIFTSPEQEADRGLHHRPLRLSDATGRDAMATEHIVKCYDEELRLHNMIAEMGGLAESQLADAIARGHRARQRARRRGRRRATSRVDQLEQRDRRPRAPAAGAAPAGGAATCARSSRRSRSPAISSGSATTPPTSPSARSRSTQIAADPAGRRHAAHGRLGHGA